MEVGYLSEDPPLIYEIPTSNFLPTFYTFRPGIMEKYNDEDLFEWVFKVYDNFGSPIVSNTVPVVNCADLIESFNDLKDDEKKSMIDALIKPMFQLCPNITSFRMQGNLFSDKKLELEIKKKSGANQKKFASTQIYLIEISRNFKPQDYR